MLLWVGLGNPGNSYAHHRHNFGFMVVDALAKVLGFSPFRQKFQGSITEGTIAGHKVLLLKPETYMNLSGQSIQAAMQFYKISLDKILVMHDDLDLALGKIRLKVGGGHGGHNGLRDIDHHIGKDYARLRLGIGHPGDKRHVSDYVLSNFMTAEKEDVSKIIEAVVDNAGLLTDPNQWPQFLNLMHQRIHNENL